MDIIEITKSAELFDKAEAIGNKFNLNINQVGELDAEIRDVIRGVSKSSDFIDHIIERLEIDKDTANKIVEEVNKEVFQVIKNFMQTNTEKSSPTNINYSKPTNNSVTAPIKDISSIEQAGNFSLEKEQESNQNLENPGSPAQILSTIEDKGTYTEPLIDHLLANPVAQAGSQPIKTLPSEQKSAPPPLNQLEKPTNPRPRTGNDPYLEPTE
jgi:hypothetical protein